MFIMSFSACRNKQAGVVEVAEDTEAEAMLQGIWVDNDTEEVTFKVKSDTIFYPDTTSLPATFKIYGDTLVIGVSAKFPIVKQAAHLFWFKNQNGDLVKLVRSDNPEDSLVFEHDKPRVMSIVTEVTKKDTVVLYNEERYHSYIAINPTKYKVLRTTYNTDGVGVDNVYYDNIIHLSVFRGSVQLYSRDLRKQMFAKFVPKQFLEQSILSNMSFNKVDAEGFHFDTTLCMPDGATCYLLDTKISFSGQMTMELLEY